MSRYIVTDATWRDAGWRPKYWHSIMGRYEMDSNARLIDRPPATTFADVYRMTSRPLWRGITKRIRAVVAAVQAYRESMK